MRDILDDIHRIPEGCLMVIPWDYGTGDRWGDNPRRYIWKATWGRGVYRGEAVVLPAAEAIEAARSMTERNVPY